MSFDQNYFRYLEKLEQKEKEESEYQQLARKFYQTTEWRNLREEVMSDPTINKGKCEWCEVTFSNDNPANVDHIKPLRHFPELGLKRSNLQVLCGNCNKAKGSKFGENAEIARLDVIEELERERINRKMIDEYVFPEKLYDKDERKKQLDAFLDPKRKTTSRKTTSSKKNKKNKVWREKIKNKKNENSC